MILAVSHMRICDSSGKKDLRRSSARWAMTSWSEPATWGTNAWSRRIHEAVNLWTVEKSVLTDLNNPSLPTFEGSLFAAYSEGSQEEYTLPRAQSQNCSVLSYLTEPMYNCSCRMNTCSRIIKVDKVQLIYFKRVHTSKEVGVRAHVLYALPCQ